MASKGIRTSAAFGKSPETNSSLAENQAGTARLIPFHRVSDSFEFRSDRAELDSKPAILLDAGASASTLTGIALSRASAMRNLLQIFSCCTSEVEIEPADIAGVILPMCQEVVTILRQAHAAAGAAELTGSAK